MILFPKFAIMLALKLQIRFGQDLIEKKREKIKYHSITHRWGNDTFCKDFSKQLDNWLHQFSDEEKPLMLIPSNNFYYYTTERINAKVKELNEQFKITYSDDYEKVFFAGIEKDFGIGFSRIICDSFWLKNGLYNRFESNLIELLRCEQIPNVISIIDDYSGKVGNLTLSVIPRKAHMRIENWLWLAFDGRQVQVFALRCSQSFHRKLIMRVGFRVGGRAGGTTCVWLVGCYFVCSLFRVDCCLFVLPFT